MRPIEWRDDHVTLIDQRLLPLEEVWVDCKDYQEVARAIREMWIRGAPAIGIAAAYGLALTAVHHQGDANGLKAALADASRVLAATRPTAVNLFWALERVEKAANRGTSVEEMRRLAVGEARQLAGEDEEMCRSIGRHGAELIGQGARVLTHCNAGALATGDYGTALGVIRAARDKLSMVWVDETRPFLQGARLTAWELVNEKIPCKLICDNMAGHFMSRGQVDAVVVGADRVTARGDVANKIGTYTLAVLCRHHNIPFYVAAPYSTIDMSLQAGADIPIEERPSDEVTDFGARRVAPLEIEVANPAFDVTPNELVTALITERGVLKAPYSESIARVMARV
ncbi:MAG: S-methyl-5-thioribose-1-phosphate isomerase [Candidatus Eremiobacteraeota bacterium]|nr:S-methyl-5-thioribose-1-phosphate isomerase [Candidatus Eremiobacteraeota bacterium]